MTTVNNDELVNSISGFPPQTSHLLLNPSTRPLFTSILVLLKVYPVLVLVLGSLGNLLSFCVLLRANMRRYSTFCYLACLALVDIGVIITFCVNFISSYHFNHDIQDGPFACKLFAFCIYFLPQYSSWILVAVSIDRVISAKYLRLAKTWSKPRHSVLVTLLLGLFLGILNSHFFLYENNSLKQRMLTLNQTEIGPFLLSDSFAGQQTDDFALMQHFSDLGAVSGSPLSFEPFTPASILRETTLQHLDETSVASKVDPLLNFDVNIIHCSLENSPEHEALHLYWVWIDLLVNVFLPFTAMIACTIIIILTLVRSSSRAGSTSVRRSRRRRNISVMLITVNLVFITLTAPIVIFLSIYPHARNKNNYYRQTLLILIKIFCIILMNLNHSVNIIIYSVTAKEFRSEMVNFLRAVVYCVIGKPINPNNLAYLHDDGSCWARFRRLRHNLFRCCRMKLGSNSSNTTDSSGLQHTTASGMNHRPSALTNTLLRSKMNKRKHRDRNGQRKSSVVRYSETSTTHRTSHRLTVQIQTDALSSTCEREDLSLHRLSNSTED